MKNTMHILVMLTLVSSCAFSQDPIEGKWKVKNDHYEAAYELFLYEGIIYGMVDHYSDGTDEHVGTGCEEDIFLTDVRPGEGRYTGGKMYVPDGSYYEVLFDMKDENTLIAFMTVKGQAYRETWTRYTE